ncbi:hypothetical protein EMCRGX_G029621 [Ephydatia muelleri]
MTQPQPDNDDFSWMNQPPEKTGSKFVRRAKENPLVPLGCLATVGALTYGLLQFKRGNMKKSQQAMRLRVLAQGGTVLALIGGILLASKQQKADK